MNKNQPSLVAQKLLAFSLPSAIRDAVLGDLQEEYNILREQKLGLFRARLWYWHQVLRTSLLYIWNQRGTTMAYLFGFLIFTAITILTLLMSGGISIFINGPSFIMVTPTAIAMAVAATSFAAGKSAFNLTFIDQENVDKEEAKQACRFLRVAGDQFVLIGIIGVLIGIAAMGGNGNIETIREWIAPAISVCVLTLLYGYIFKSLFYSAEQKIIGRYLDE